MLYPTEISKEQVVNSIDNKSKDFITSWLSNRKSILLQNIKSYDRTYPDGNIPTYEDSRINNILSSQTNNFNKSPINVVNKLSSGLYGEYDKKNNQISINKNIFNKGDSTLLNNTIFHERVNSLRPMPQEVAINELKQKHSIYNYTEDAEYTNRSGEIYARLMTFRKENNLTPFHVVTPENLKDWKGKLKNADLSQYSSKFLLDLFNTVASVSQPNKSIFNSKQNIT
jgi:hypothetical protein